ncbi:MAG: YraN family protein [Longimicrobiales bacterium]
MSRTTGSGNPSLTIGRKGEEAAATYLRGQGWVVLARNYRAGPKEIDVIIGKGRLVAFVEVKSRLSDTGLDPAGRVGRQKMRTTVDAARHWIQRHGQPGQGYRFDVVTVEDVGGSCRLTHIPDAWRP